LLLEGAVRIDLVSSSALAALLLAGAASAQSSAAADDRVIVTGARATTATKTDTPLIRTPQSISVIDQSQIFDRGALNAQETLRYTAGAAAEAFGLDTRGDGPALRGFGTAQYQDGLRKVFGFNLVPRAEVYTMERVEVLRGPSSMLYGQASTGGVVNYISKRPEFERGGEVALQLGSYDRVQGMLDVTSPLGGDFAGRLVAVARDAGMQTREVEDDRIVVAPSLTWRATPDTTITLLGLYQDDHTASSQQFLPYVATLQDDFPKLPVEAFLGEPDYDRLDTEQASLTLLASHRFSDAFSVNANVRYVDATADFREIYPDVYSNAADPFVGPDKRMLNRFVYAIDSDVEILTSDINATYDLDTGPVHHTILGGVDVLRFRQSSATASGSAPAIDAYAPVYGQDWTPPELVAMPDLDQDQVGLYVQDQAQWGRLTAVAGVRFDSATQETAGTPEQEDEATTFRVGAIYDLGRGIAPYVSYSESFEPVAGQDFFGVAFKPQRGEQVEVGVKWQPVANALITLAAYDLTETNRLINDPDNVVNVIQTGELSGQGVELEAAWTLPGDLTLTGAVSHAETEVVNSSAPYEIGHQVSDTPKTQASAWAVKTVALSQGASLRVGGGVRYVGPTRSIGATNTIRTPSYTVVDGLLAVDWKQYSLTVSATNLFDNEYVAPCRFFGDCFTGQGQNVVATLGYRF
jgi:iron complex outermembrane receptor protein